VDDITRGGMTDHQEKRGEQRADERDSKLSANRRNRRGATTR